MRHVKAMMMAHPPGGVGGGGSGGGDYPPGGGGGGGGWRHSGHRDHWASEEEDDEWNEDEWASAYDSWTDLRRRYTFYTVGRNFIFKWTAPSFVGGGARPPL